MVKLPVVNMGVHAVVFFRHLRKCKNEFSADKCSISSAMKPLSGYWDRNDQPFTELLSKLGAWPVFKNPHYDPKSSDEHEEYLSRRQLKVRLSVMFKDLFNRFIFKMFSYVKDGEMNSTIGTEKYDRFSSFFHDPISLSRLDSLLQLLRDARQFMAFEEDRDKKELGMSKSVIQQDIDFMKAELREMPTKKGSLLREITHRSIPKLFDLFQELEPFQFYINVYNPALLGELASDYYCQLLNKPLEFFQLAQKILKSIITFRVDNTVEFKTTLFYNFVRQHIYEPIMTYDPKETPTMTFLNKQNLKPGGAFARVRKRMYECRKTGDETLGKCFHWTRPCINDTERTSESMSSRCTPCKKGDNDCSIPNTKRPWNVPVKMTQESIQRQLLDILATAPQNISVAYQACTMKESKKNIRSTEAQCPSVALPEPNALKLFRKKETAHFEYFWNSVKIVKGNEEVIHKANKANNFQHDTTRHVPTQHVPQNVQSGWSQEGNAVEGFTCNDDCAHCYGDEGYVFPDAEGFEVEHVPSTMAYNENIDSSADIPWIRKENWNSATGMYRPHCECEPSYNGARACQGVKRKNATMVCELVRNGGILNGCHEGHFVVSAKRGNASACFLVQMKLERVNHDLTFGVLENRKFDLSHSCAHKYIGTFTDSRKPQARRSRVTVQALTNDCPNGFSRDSKLTTHARKYCQKDKDTFDDAFQLIDKDDGQTGVQKRRRRRRLLTQYGASTGNGS